jgi:hypothetical protein
MWESVVIVVIVGAALFFTVRPLVRFMMSKDGYCEGCAGCCQASVCLATAGGKKEKQRDRKMTCRS